MSEKTFREKLCEALKLPPGTSDENIIAVAAKSIEINAWEVAISNKINESGGALTRDGAIQVLTAQKSTRTDSTK